MLILFLIFIIFAIILWISIKQYKETSYFRITGKGYFTVLFNTGDLGEYLIYKYLKKFETNGARFLFNIYLPRDKGETTEIDVLMISPSGLFVFESKNYSGWIFGDEKGKTWTQTLPNGKKSHKEHFFNPILQNQLHIKWLNSFINNETIPVHSLIVFSERCTLKKVTVYNQNINVIKRDQVYGIVKQLYNMYPKVMTETEINELYDKLYSLTQVSSDVKQKHIESIQEKHTLKEHKLGEICPRCGAILILRTTKKGDNKGKQFWGCSSYPKCRYMKKI